MTQKTPLLLILLLIVYGGYAQRRATSVETESKSKSHKIGIGFKAGLNFANVTSSSSLNNSSRTGYMAGIFLAPSTHGIFGYRTELLYSRQGYDYKNNRNTGSVNLDYILFTHLFTINISKFVQFQLGGLTAFLLNAKADSTQSSQPPNPYTSSYMSFYNKFDYGATGGIEIHPILGLLIGARYNYFFGDLYKTPGTASSFEKPSFIPTVNVKNNLVQIFVGYSF
jgi:hypothetical protein